MLNSRLSSGGLISRGEWSDFRDRVFSREDKADLVVAIARKMPRLMEYLGYLESPPCPVISERALPWITNSQLQRAHIRFCDDVLNVGTTLSHYVNYALQRGLGRASIVVYARREKYRYRQEQAFLVEQGLTVLQSFDDESYWQFETALPQFLLSTGKPYDLDFPIISIPLSESDASRSVEDWHCLLLRFFSSVHNLTTPLQRKIGVASFTLLEPLDIGLDDLVRPYERDVSPIPKIRLYIHAPSRTLRVTPMCIPVVHSDELRRTNILSDPDLDTTYCRLIRCAHEGSPLPLEPVYNLLVYLVSFEYGRYFAHRFWEIFGGAGSFSADISGDDLRFLFGQEIGIELQGLLTTRLGALTQSPAFRSTGGVLVEPKAPLNQQLVEGTVERLRQKGYQGASLAEIFREALRALDESVQANDPNDDKQRDYGRLRTGFSLCDLWWIWRELSPNPEMSTLPHLSFLLDYFVDLGVVVPVVGNVRDLYCRIYRRGEADPMEYARFVHTLLKEHDELYPNAPLDVTMFTKILATQAVYHPGLVPLDPVFDFLGTVPYWVQPELVERQTIRALDFLSDRGVVTVETSDDRDREQLPLFEE